MLRQVSVSVGRNVWKDILSFHTIQEKYRFVVIYSGVYLFMCFCPKAWMTTPYSFVSSRDSPTRLFFPSRRASSTRRYVCLPSIGLNSLYSFEFHLSFIQTTVHEIVALLWLLSYWPLLGSCEYGPICQARIGLFTSIAKTKFVNPLSTDKPSTHTSRFVWQHQQTMCEQLLGLS